MKFTIMNERHVIDVKVKRKQRRTGLRTCLHGVPHLHLNRPLVFEVTIVLLFLGHKWLTTLDLVLDLKSTSIIGTKKTISNEIF